MTLPSEIVVFKLLKKANICMKKKMLGLTGIEYSIKKYYARQQKGLLKKFKMSIVEGQAIQA